MSVVAENRAPSLIEQLVGQAQIDAKNLSLPMLTTISGLDKLIAEFDKKNKSDSTTILHNKVFAFFDYIWEKTMSVYEFVAEFHAMLVKIALLNLKTELKGHLLIPQAKLDGHDMNNVIGSAGGDYSLQALTNSVQNSYCTKGLPSSLMATFRASRRRCAHCMPYKSSHGSSNTALREQCDPKPLPFYLYIGAPASESGGAAVIDSGDFASMAG